MKNLWDKIKKGWKWITGLFVVAAVAATVVNFPVEPPPIVVVSPTPVVATYFAEINEEGTVLRVLVVTQEFINTGKLGDPKNWVETTLDGSKRKNYAGVGYQYDKVRDAFISPKPEGNYILNELTGKWIKL